MPQRNKKKIRVPDTVKDFGNSEFKKYKKQNKAYYDSKKELKESYFSELLYGLPDTIEFLLKFSHIQEDDVKEAKTSCYRQLSGKKESPAFIKYITKIVKEEGVGSIPKLELFPIILHDIISDINKYNEEAKKEDPNAQVFDASELYELITLIMKKKLKKAKSKDINDDVAFDIFSIIPCADAMKYSPYFRIKSVFDVLYYHSKTKQIDFKKVMKVLVDPEYYDIVISFALQERKEKFQKFNEQQKAFFNDISSWIFDELEDMDKNTITNILTTYINARKRDAANNKDGNRRYFVASLPDTIYPRICKIVEKLKQQDPDNEKYL